MEWTPAPGSSTQISYAHISSISLRSANCTLASLLPFPITYCLTLGDTGSFLQKISFDIFLFLFLGLCVSPFLLKSTAEPSLHQAQREVGGNGTTVSATQLPCAWAGPLYPCNEGASSDPCQKWLPLWLPFSSSREPRYFSIGPFGDCYLRRGTSSSESCFWIFPGSSLLLTLQATHHIQLVALPVEKINLPSHPSTTSLDSRHLPSA